jgi:hypothetical protein
LIKSVFTVNGIKIVVAAIFLLFLGNQFYAYLTGTLPQQ